MADLSDGHFRYAKLIEEHPKHIPELLTDK